MLYPLRFRPIFKERIWGGRRLEILYNKPLPKGMVIGESWEISDRAGDESEVINGPLKGKTLHDLVQSYKSELMGNASLVHGRFPLLIKILDAQDKLSLQVHPPLDKASELGGDPKTEMWYVAEATPEADIYAGLRKGATRAEFQSKLGNPALASCFHRIPVKKGDAMFMPSGRVHALGAGPVIFEIQENSDTTFRVYDWDRVDASGKPRQLHVEESLESINFNDFEPALISSSSGVLVDDPLFRVEFRSIRNSIAKIPGKFVILAILQGNVAVSSDTEEFSLNKGEFCLVPASVQSQIKGVGADILWIEPGTK